jgi:hypothetical protein
MAFDIHFHSLDLIQAASHHSSAVTRDSDREATKAAAAFVDSIAATAAAIAPALPSSGMQQMTQLG